MRGRGIALALVALLLFALPPGAYAKEYVGTSHYRLEVPDDWTQTSVSGADVVFTGPAFQDFPANMNVIVVTEASARDDASWLLQQAQAGYSQVLSQFAGATGSQAPRSFTTASGRLAADYIIDYTISGTTLRVRQVLFASDSWNRAYILTFTAHRSVYPSHESVWRTAVDTFTVLDESAASSLVAPVAIVVVLLLVVIIAVAVVMVRRRKKTPPWVPPAAPPSGPEFGAPPVPPQEPLPPPGTPP